MKSPREGRRKRKERLPNPSCPVIVSGFSEPPLPLFPSTSPIQRAKQTSQIPPTLFHLPLFPSFACRHPLQPPASNLHPPRKPFIESYDPILRPHIPPPKPPPSIILCDKRIFPRRLLTGQATGGVEREKGSGSEGKGEWVGGKGKGKGNGRGNAPSRAETGLNTATSNLHRLRKPFIESYDPMLRPPSPPPSNTTRTGTGTQRVFSNPYCHAMV